MSLLPDSPTLFSFAQTGGQYLYRLRKRKDGLESQGRLYSLCLWFPFLGAVYLFFLLPFFVSENKGGINK